MRQLGRAILQAGPKGARARRTPKKNFEAMIRDECWVWLPPTQQFICFPSAEADSEGVEYVRFMNKAGKELLYYDQQEWADAPKEVMGAIMGALLKGAA